MQGCTTERPRVTNSRRQIPDETQTKRARSNGFGCGYPLFLVVVLLRACHPVRRGDISAVHDDKEGMGLIVQEGRSRVGARSSDRVGYCGIFCSSGQGGIGGMFEGYL